MGRATAELGPRDALLAWKMDTNRGGWAGEEWQIFGPEEVVGYFQGVGVNADDRGAGVARALIADMLQAMEAKGPDSIWGVVAPMDEDTDGGGLVRLYASFGFEPVDLDGRDPETPMMLKRYATREGSSGRRKSPSPPTILTLREPRAGNGALERVSVQAHRGTRLVGEAVAYVGLREDLREWFDALLDARAWREIPAGRSACVATVQVASKGRGLGTVLLRKLMEALDEVRTLWLVAVPLDGDTDPDRLVEFYRRAGFTVMPGHADDPDPLMWFRRAGGPAKAPRTPLIRKNPPARVPAFLRSGEAAWRWARAHTDVLSALKIDDFEVDAVEQIFRDRADVYARFARSLEGHETIELYRAIAIPAHADPHAAIEFRCLGKSWSRYARCTGIYNGPSFQGKHREVVVRAEAPTRGIDWPFGFTSFLFYGEDQWEVSLKPHTRLVVHAVDGRACLPPIRASTGEAGESWSHTCGVASALRAVAAQAREACLKGGASYGRCADVSRAVLRGIERDAKLSRLGHATLVEGSVRVDRSPQRGVGRLLPHYWVRVGGYDVDASADQFNSLQRTFRFEEVLVGPRGKLPRHVEEDEVQ